MSKCLIALRDQVSLISQNLEVLQEGLPQMDQACEDFVQGAQAHAGKRTQNKQLLSVSFFQDLWTFDTHLSYNQILTSVMVLHSIILLIMFQANMLRNNKLACDTKFLISLQPKEKRTFCQLLLIRAYWMYAV